MSCGFLLLDGLALDRDRCPIVAGLVKIENVSERNGSTFHSLENISQMYLSTKGVLRSISAATFLTALSATVTYKLPIHINRKAVSSGVIRSLAGLSNFGVGWLFNSHFQSSYISLL